MSDPYANVTRAIDYAFRTYSGGATRQELAARDAERKAEANQSLARAQERVHRAVAVAMVSEYSREFSRLVLELLAMHSPVLSGYYLECAHCGEYGYEGDTSWPCPTAELALTKSNPNKEN